MTIPLDLQHTTEAFDRFLADARRRRGSARAIRPTPWWRGSGGVPAAAVGGGGDPLCGVLPPVLRAIFVADWDTAEPRRPFADRAAMTAEVQDLRRHHNFAPASAIADVAAALRRNMDADKLDRVLATLPDGAADFWKA